MTPKQVVLAEQGRHPKRYANGICVKSAGAPAPHPGLPTAS